MNFLLIVNNGILFIQLFAILRACECEREKGETFSKYMIDFKRILWYNIWYYVSSKDLCSSQAENGTG